MIWMKRRVMERKGLFDVIYLVFFWLDSGYKLFSIVLERVVVILGVVYVIFDFVGFGIKDVCEKSDICVV